VRLPSLNAHGGYGHVWNAGTGIVGHISADAAGDGLRERIGGNEEKKTH
jgi:hypothetical protein